MRALRAALLAYLAIEAAAMGVLIFLAARANVEDAPEQRQLLWQTMDNDLLTPQEKEAARESGVADYYLGGTHYVDYTLSPEYWEE